MDLVCAYPAQPHVITKFHEGEFNSSYLCFSEKESENLVTERRRFHMLDWSWKHYIDYCGLRPWFVYGVVQTTRTPPVPPAPSQGYNKPQEWGVHLQPQCTSMMVFIPVQKQQDLRPGVTQWVCCVLLLLYRAVTPPTAEDSLWLVTVCERGVNPRKSTAEHIAEDFSWRGANLCCGIALFLSSVLEKVHPRFAGSKTLTTSSPPLHCVSWHLLCLSGHTFSLHEKPWAQGGCAVAAEQHGHTSGDKVWSPSLPLLLLPGQTDPVSCRLLQVTMGLVPASPKVHLHFLAAGLGWARNRPCACFGSSASCLPRADLPCPLDLWDYSCCAFSRRRPLSCCCSVSEGDSERGKKKIPLQWPAFVVGRNQRPGHAAEAPLEKHGCPCVHWPPPGHCFPSGVCSAALVSSHEGPCSTKLCPSCPIF